MTEEAREAAWQDAHDVWTLESGEPMSEDEMRLSDTFFDVGVAEGIRRAREAAVTDAEVDAAYHGWRAAQRGGPLEPGEYEATFSRVEFAWMRAAIEATRD